MFPGYNTNGFAHHRLEDAVAILAELGFAGIALTPDFNHLNVLDERELQLNVERLAGLLQKHDLKCVIETGSRFLLDPWRKHQPTLLSANEADRARRFGFLEACISLAKVLNSEVVSFWSGKADAECADGELFRRLASECQRLSEIAADHDVRLAFEPEPGMFIDTMAKFATLHEMVNHPNFGLTVDVGHLVCNNELPIRNYLREFRHCLWNVHIEDMRPGVHDHLMFGEGTVDFADVFAGLSEVNFQGMVSVELSRHSFDAVSIARRSFEFLQPWFRS